MLELKNLRFSYRDQRVLDDVSMNLRPGTVLGLLGHNGAGKTTLLSLISGLLPLQDGEILLNGQDLHASAKSFPSPLAIVPQDFAFYPMLSCRENLRFFGGVQGLSGSRLKQRVEICLEFSQLQAYAGKYAETLSGGLKRRLNLAIGLLADPEILLLDEPTTGVDPVSRQALLKSIAGLKDQGKTLIYTSHYLDEVEQLADDLVILDRGRILLQGRWEEIRRARSGQWDLQLADPLPDSDLISLRRLAEVQTLDAGHYRIDAKPETDSRTLWQWLAGIEIPVRALYTGEASLERLYLRLIQEGERSL